MSRLLFLFAVIVAVYWLLKTYRKQSPKQDAPATSSEDMVRCAQCGVHLPKSEAIQSSGNLFCSEAHRREYESR
ncbi:MAG: PP0621 family protein [Gallionella sp.]|nr:PP0621 family protein [Gallionella sp.]